MARYEPDQVAHVLALQQLVADWCDDLDRNDCNGIPRLCTTDVEYRVGGVPQYGHDAVAAFYAARNERVRTQQRDGVRTQRHSVSNIRIAFPSAGRATLDFLLINYSAEGPAPALNLIGPTIIADTRFECALGDDGEWLIALFNSTPVFIGNDPFLNAAVVPK